MEMFRLFKSTREYLTPVLTESAFYERGMLTPEEFVRAGDHLIRNCPTWRWESGEKSNERSYLPPNKQYLVTKGVPSYRRVSSLQESQLKEETIKTEITTASSKGKGQVVSNEDWCAPTLEPPKLSKLDDEELVNVDDEVEIVKSNEKGTPSTNADANSSSNAKQVSNNKDDYEYTDMEDDALALDEASTNINPANSQPISNSNTVQSRRYDVSITYDNYYRTPRIWLYGYNESGSILSADQIFEDIIIDYAKKTVTIDPHPHLSKPHGNHPTHCILLHDNHSIIPTASIHPCQHGPAMLKILEALKECNQVPTVDQYLFIFLKFIQSVVPTIEYDNTVDVQIRGKDIEKEDTNIKKMG